MEKSIAYFVQSYQHKARPLAMALKQAGFVPSHGSPDVALFDRPVTPKAEFYNRKGAAIMEYPHSALPPWWYDGIEEFPDYVKCVFVVGEGQKEAMKTIEPKANVQVCGFPWAKQLPFQKKPVKRILFAPIHPSRTAIRPEAKEVNRRIQEALLQLDGYQVTCRTLGDRSLQGIKEPTSMKMVRAGPDGKTQHIDNADLVIAEGTMLFLAVARGKPAIGINQSVVNRYNYDSDENEPKNWDNYNGYFRYPIDFDDAPLSELIEYAAGGEQLEWRQRCLPPFNGENFAELVREEYFKWT